jgi:hypothetical protein
MNEFYQGLIAGISMLGGLCAFNYWVFNLMEKRIDLKLDKVIVDIHAIAEEVKEDRRDKAKLYTFVMDNTRN